jgi:hypothetical protein
MAGGGGGSGGSGSRGGGGGVDSSQPGAGRHLGRQFGAPLVEKQASPVRNVLGSIQTVTDWIALR